MGKLNDGVALQGFNIFFRKRWNYLFELLAVIFAKLAFEALNVVGDCMLFQDSFVHDRFIVCFGHEDFSYELEEITLLDEGEGKVAKEKDDDFKYTGYISHQV